ncbi:conserved hypothetical protein [Ricinus communis]|uniref:Uncharacterized protein n=1 Tax=Ricinus communis TaxID=3988 RepID=B9TJX2_RICCO|nr:conserved hypothetical protein [Ricinus communis]
MTKDHVRTITFCLKCYQARREPGRVVDARRCLASRRHGPARRRAGADAARPSAVALAVVPAVAVAARHPVRARPGRRFAGIDGPGHDPGRGLAPATRRYR